MVKHYLWPASPAPPPTVYLSCTPSLYSPTWGTILGAFCLQLPQWICFRPLSAVQCVYVLLEPNYSNRCLWPERVPIRCWTWFPGSLASASLPVYSWTSSGKASLSPRLCFAWKWRALIFSGSRFFPVFLGPLANPMPHKWQSLPLHPHSSSRTLKFTVVKLPEICF